MSPTARSKSAWARAGIVPEPTGCAAPAGAGALGAALAFGAASGFAGGALWQAPASSATATSAAESHSLLKRRDHILRELCFGVTRGLKFREHGITLLHPLVVDTVLGAP